MGSAVVHAGSTQLHNVCFYFIITRSPFYTRGQRLCSVCLILPKSEFSTWPIRKENSGGGDGETVGVERPCASLVTVRETDHLSTPPPGSPTPGVTCTQGHLPPGLFHLTTQFSSGGSNGGSCPLASHVNEEVETSAGCLPSPHPPSPTSSCSPPISEHDCLSVQPGEE